MSKPGTLATQANPTQLILASTSMYRRRLLDRLGIPFHVEDPQTDEAEIQARGLNPVELARTLARAKAESIRDHHPEAVIIGCDQVADLDGDILGKPGSPEASRVQLARLAGREHRLTTALCLLTPSRMRENISIARMTMRPLDEETIARYVALDQPLDCAGSYKIESRGVVLFERIESDDWTAIEGLPLIALLRHLGRAGFPLPLFHGQ